MSTSLSRRQLLRMGALSASSMLLAACQAKVVEKIVKETVVTVPTPVKLEPVDLRCSLYTFQPLVSWMEQVTKLYSTTHPNVKVKVEVAPWDEWNQKLFSQLAAGTAPDYWTGPYLDIAMKGQALELTDYAAKIGWSWDDFWPIYKMEACVDPATGLQGGNRFFYGPLDVTCFIYCHNVDMFTEAKVDLPTASWTWDDLRAAAKSLTLDAAGRSSGSAGFDPDNVRQWGITGLTSWKLLQPLLRAVDEDYVDLAKSDKCLINTPGAKAVLQFVADLIHVDHSMPSPQIMEGLSSPFINGQIGIQASGSWNVGPWSRAKFKAALMDVPLSPKGKRFAAGYTTNGFMGYAKTKAPDVLADLLLYFGGETAQELIPLIEGGIPARKSAFKTAEDAYEALGGFSTLKDTILPNTAPAGNWGPKANEIESVWGQETAKLWLGEATVDQVVASLEKRTNETLAKE